jgi:hypothetical protein
MYNEDMFSSLHGHSYILKSVLFKKCPFLCFNWYKWEVTSQINSTASKLPLSFNWPQLEHHPKPTQLHTLWDLLFWNPLQPLDRKQGWSKRCEFQNCQFYGRCLFWKTKLSVRYTWQMRYTCNMDEPGVHEARQILHDLIYTWNLKKSSS